MSSALLCSAPTTHWGYSTVAVPDLAGTVAVMERRTRLPSSSSSFGLNYIFRVPIDTAIEVVLYTSRISPVAFWTNLAVLIGSPTLSLTNPTESWINPTATLIRLVVALSITLSLNLTAPHCISGWCRWANLTRATSLEGRWDALLPVQRLGNSVPVSHAFSQSINKLLDHGTGNSHDY